MAFSNGSVPRAKGLKADEKRKSTLGALFIARTDNVPGLDGASFSFSSSSGPHGQFSFTTSTSTSGPQGQSQWTTVSVRDQHGVRAIRQSRTTAPDQPQSPHGGVSIPQFQLPGGSFQSMDPGLVERFAGQPSFMQFPHMEMMGGSSRSAMLRQLLRFGGGGLQNFNPDNMSRDDLLSLQERLGVVSRGASEETISSLPTSTYQETCPNSPGAPPDPDLGTAGPGQHLAAALGSKATLASAQNSDRQRNCCICLEDFTDGDEIRRLPCLHIFHTAEIDQWLRANRVCPICKTSVDSS